MMIKNNTAVYSATASDCIKFQFGSMTFAVLPAFSLLLFGVYPCMASACDPHFFMRMGREMEALIAEGELI